MKFDYDRAFPQGAPEELEPKNGMLLLDYFAIRALPLALKVVKNDAGDFAYDEVAREAYAMAYHMIQARETFLKKVAGS